MSKYDISARVNPLKDTSKNVKAMASITINNSIAINDMTIVEGKNGHFVGYPQSRDKDGNFRDIVEFGRDENDKMTKEAMELKNAISKLLVDMYKNGEKETPKLEEAQKTTHELEIKAFVSVLRESENATKGLATVQIDDVLKINSIRINENTKEGSDNFGKNFVAMPSRPDKHNETGYRDVVHPVSKEFGENLKTAVLKQFDVQVSWKNREAAKTQEAPQNERQANNKSAHDLG